MGLGGMCGEFLQVCLGLGEEGVGLNDGQLKAGAGHQVRRLRALPGAGAMWGTVNRPARMWENGNQAVTE